ncbi:uncharacterized protein L3040_005723 [Drepanopeziza brunnea f. sp. 'multigermtubi']|uniref:Uncharacterized protein n=1 Tax=Marssonina brunnea f. sp. multigermtubi (strain MB_m1) TaxID=1072389 RepID=K1WAX6_MARBU|nr:uncharacterized protein MBM_07166 [Drepanopeziza brunnea f. sp. 'multigermtubi' MB_m1]EKD14445.1 hypothetical protein MBM_07166 [Drepanopeziza brunnea f. sp. 'multigermtubi' MB_m1]KAJ5041172.1 hypothetical protein L3040_005723 [Drepanopeziza brunnea f. sp. 'multigermtubi']
MAFLTSYPPFPVTGVPRLSFFTQTTTSAILTPTQTAIFHESDSSTSTSSSESWESSPTASGSPDSSKDAFLDNLDSGKKAAIGVGIGVFVLLIFLVSVWYCCGGCGFRARRRKRLQRATQVLPSVPATHLPAVLGSMQSVDIAVPRTGEAPPPVYEVAIPPQHRYVAGGATHITEEEEGIISDGKMPLSEIPFEDVVLDHPPSEGSSRSFSERHYGLGGDTTGHTNS